MSLKWFTFSQNNSGGYFIVNNLVDQYVIIQAPGASEAVKKADKIFEDYSDFCDCCGERWCTEFVNDSDGENIAMIYDKPVTHVRAGTFRKSAILHLWDGRVVKVLFKDESAHQDDLNDAEWISGQGEIGSLGALN